MARIFPQLKANGLTPNFKGVPRVRPLVGGSEILLPHIFSFGFHKNAHFHRRARVYIRAIGG